MILLFWLSLVAGCTRDSGDNSHVLEGSILKKEPAIQQVTISHGDIPGFMPAMTMDYRIEDLGTFRELQPGDRIAAELHTSKDGTNSWLQNIKITDRSRRGIVFGGPPHILKPGEPIPDVPLVNQDGKTIQFSQFRGAALLVTFTYTRCPLLNFCPRITNQFAAIHDKLVKNPTFLGKFHFVSISLDPKYDKPEVLRKYGLAYMKYPEGFSNWDFASPSAGDLPNLAYAFGLQYYPEGNQIAHSVATFLISPEGTLARIWPDNEWKPAEVLHALLDEARSAKGIKAKTAKVQKGQVLAVGFVRLLGAARHSNSV